MSLLRLLYKDNSGLHSALDLEGLADRNGNIRKVVGERKSVSCVGAQKKGKGCNCKLTKNMSLQIDLLELFLKRGHNISEFFPDTTYFRIKKLAMRTNEKNI